MSQELSRFMGNYYRNHFRRVVKLLWVMLVLSALLVAIMAWLYISGPKAPSKFYASNMHNGVVTAVYTLSAPVVKPAKLLQWSKNHVMAALTFNFVNYRDVFSNVQSGFTTTGWQSFNNFLQNSRILDAVTKQKLFVAATITGQATIVGEGLVNSHYAWTIKMPLLLTYKSDTTKPVTQKLMLNIIVVRVANLDVPGDVAINDFEVQG